MKSKYTNFTLVETGYLKHKIGGRVAPNKGSSAEALIGGSGVRTAGQSVWGTAKETLTPKVRGTPGGAGPRGAIQKVLVFNSRKGVHVPAA